MAESAPITVSQSIVSRFRAGGRASRHLAATSMIALGVALSAPSALAQVQGEADERAKVETLDVGFTPDPAVFDVALGPQDGAINAAALGPTCGGSINVARPRVRIAYSAGDAPLYISGEADGETALIVQTPNGGFVCQDSSWGESSHPAVTFDDPTSGVYGVWLADLAERTTTGRVYVSELGLGPTAVPPSDNNRPVEMAAPDGPTPSFRAQLNEDAPAQFAAQPLPLAAGFDGDPREIAVTAGGALDVSDADDQCFGVFSAAPTYAIDYTSSATSLFLSASSEADTVMMVKTPNGAWRCNDDHSNGTLNAGVSFERPEAGIYTVWVGLYSMFDSPDNSGTAPATLVVSELGFGANPVGGVEFPTRPNANGQPEVPNETPPALFPTPAGPGAPGAGKVAVNGIDPSGAPLHGAMTIQQGFDPDPRVVDVTATGEFSAESLPGGCFGLVTARPQYAVNYAGGAAPLYLAATSSADAVMVVNTPDGRWLCDDDSAGQLNPGLMITGPAAGRYDIWVGVYNESEAPAQLTISSRAFDGAGGADVAEPPFQDPIAPQLRPVAGGDLNPNAPPSDGTSTLTAGFADDPRTSPVTAGGPVDAENLGGLCVGWVSAAPQHVLTYEANNTFDLFLSAEADEGQDLVMVVQTPNGEFLCNDDRGDVDYAEGAGYFPGLQISDPEAGDYTIWVGTYDQGATIAAQLNMSEVRFFP